MDNRAILVISRSWLLGADGHMDRLRRQHLIPLSEGPLPLSDGAEVFIRYRMPGRGVELDAGARIVRLKDRTYLKSIPVASAIADLDTDSTYLVVDLEGPSDAMRCTVAIADSELFAQLEAESPATRLFAFDLPPTVSSFVRSPEVVALVSARLQSDDPDLFSVQASKFLDSPHILVPLFRHILSLSGEENIRFPIQLKNLSEQIRTLLQDARSSHVRIHELSKSHRDTWGDMKGKAVSFLDGGMARIASLPITDPLALRVGVYTVRPGLEDPTRREDWMLAPFVLGDITVRAPGWETKHHAVPIPKRLQEAALYTLEPLTALDTLRRIPDASMLLMHGPLVNQFAQYDEGEPNFLPCLRPDFLNRYGLSQNRVESLVQRIPTVGGDSLWNQFMAVYGAVAKEIMEHVTPIAGVVERTAGAWLTRAVLASLVSDGLITKALHDRISHEVIDVYQISDDFLFGCVLREGEYLTPVRIAKNAAVNRAREHWQDVVKAYPSPYATILKTGETSFPFRVEMNEAACLDTQRVVNLIYHTARLLPRYAFPVGLDTVDKFAKIPDWISRGVSARISAEVLRRAVQTGDPHLVANVRQFLARSPRDFFFRPST